VNDELFIKQVTMGQLRIFIESEEERRFACFARTFKNVIVWMLVKIVK